MIVPELPSYLESLGGGQYKGLIISLFTVTAMLSRPFSGRLADKVGRVPVMMAGSAVCFICSLIYPILAGVSGFLWLRLVHGFSTGFTPTGQTAYLSDLVPAERRGEAMGYLGTAGSVGMASGPAIGGLLAFHFNLDAVFYCSSAFALCSILIVLNIKETLPGRGKFSFNAIAIRKEDLFEPRVLMPCIVILLTTYAYGAVFTVIPDLGESLGIKNKGLVFTYLTLASLSVRLIGGRASDRFGRRNVLFFSSMLIVLSMIVIAFADTKLILFAGCVLYGFAQGITSPTLLAWATDLSDARFKGRGLSSLYIFMELGIGIGAFASGFIYGNDSSRFTITFLICSGFAFIAFLYLIFTKMKEAR